jgi:hypothetical protein
MERLKIADGEGTEVVLLIQRKSFENMVARDGVEPPTPAFSGLATTIANLLINKKMSA